MVLSVLCSPVAKFVFVLVAWKRMNRNDEQKSKEDLFNHIFCFYYHFLLHFVAYCWTMVRIVWAGCYSWYNCKSYRARVRIRTANRFNRFCESSKHIFGQIYSVELWLWNFIGILCVFVTKYSKLLISNWLGPSLLMF